MATVCIIGGGPSGLSALSEIHERGDGQFQATCLEKQNAPGGLWHFDERTGVDHASFFSGQVVHGSMYLNLTSNGPKECLEFMDYTFDEHFAKPIGSFPPREVLYDYLKGKFAKVIPYVQCGCEVYNVTPIYGSEGHPRFEVCWTDGKGAHLSRTFDYVVVASGHFSTPNIPDFKGLAEFEATFGDGSVIHAHNFRNGKAYQGKNILTVGASYSAEDIASQCLKYDVGNVTMCSRGRDMGCFKWPSNVVCKKNLERIDVDEKKVYYSDGSFSEGLPDNIILCTGYVHSFPFLSPEIAITPKRNTLVLEQLYKGIFLEHCPRVMYLGMQDQWFTFSLFLGQASYMLQCLKDEQSGKKFPPPLEIMQAHTKDQLDQEAKLKTDEDLFTFQGEYLRYCFKHGACEDAKSKIDHYTAHTLGLFVDWERNKHEDILTFRDHCHASHHSPTKLAPQRTLPWMKETNLGCMREWLSDHNVDVKWQVAAPTMSCTEMGLNFDRKREPDFAWVGPFHAFTAEEISQLKGAAAGAKLYSNAKRSGTKTSFIGRGDRQLMRLVGRANLPHRIGTIVRERLGCSNAHFKLHPNSVEWAHLLVQDVESGASNTRETWHLDYVPYVLVTNLSEQLAQSQQLRTDAGAILTTTPPGQSILLFGSKVLHCGKTLPGDAGKSVMLVTSMTRQSDDQMAISLHARKSETANYPTVPRDVQTAAL